MSLAGKIYDMARISKEKKEQIRKDILAVASNSFFKKGYEKTSTKEIAKQVGIAEGTLFNYFSTKADLYMEAFTSEFQRNEDQLMQPELISNYANELIADYVQKLYSPVLKIPKFIMKEMIQVFFSMGKKNFARIERLASIDFKYMAMTEDYIERLIQEGLILPDTDAKLLSESIYSAIFYEFSMFVYYEKATKEELIDKIKKKIDFICKGYLS